MIINYKLSKEINKNKSLAKLMQGLMTLCFARKCTPSKIVDCIQYLKPNIISMKIIERTEILVSN
ncbi:hypothetical protein BpHYR1_051567 [Brachionus plicatilis]|uniref:Uncharacterized protein n=1 Tax=Brachionus plicatilis TaxID=10195 RepID=A0A3M7RMF8_BRAPC|nr:hypothetical protein BpHYR1_051567 [Brachionus plicatilis]